MKKLYTILFTVAIVGNAVFAQNDANAKKILDAVTTKMKSFKAVTANFTLKSTTKKGKSNGTKTGSVSFKGQKYFLKQEKTEIICDGINVYNYDASNNTITKSSVADANQTLSPQNLLSNFYDKDFTYKLISSIGNYHEIELIPIDKKKNLEKVHVVVDKVKNMITKVKITDKGGNIINFTLSNLNTAATIPESIFTFNKSKYPADVDMLD